MMRARRGRTVRLRSTTLGGGGAGLAGADVGGGAGDEVFGAAAEDVAHRSDDLQRDAFGLLVDEAVDLWPGQGDPRSASRGMRSVVL